MKDAVCQMDVDEHEARQRGLMSEHRGKDFFFCSQTCKEKFDEQPQLFAEHYCSDWNAEESEETQQGEGI